jgi:hypothetical protein
MAAAFLSATTINNEVSDRLHYNKSCGNTYTLHSDVLFMFPVFCFFTAHAITGVLFTTFIHARRNGW